LVKRGDPTRPGVDGDVVGIVASSEDFDRTLMRTIELEASQSGFAFVRLPEAQFATELAKTAGQ
jgi:hypothetical protein